MTTLISCLNQRNLHIRPNYPNSWPLPTYDFRAHPLNSLQIELGRKLFYDPILSLDSSISCASCHSPHSSFTHTDHSLSHGIFDSIGKRNSPVLVNLAWNKHFMWDGAVNNIEVQALAPIHNPIEMGENLDNILIKIERHEHYPTLFKKAFKDQSVSSNNLLMSLAQFQLSLMSSNSKYDRMKSGTAVFTEMESKGYELFKAKCASCHIEPLFTSGNFENNGLPLDEELKDYGRSEISGQEDDRRKFKVPTLRNIGVSQPYMHDGRFNSLYEVLDHYSNGIEKSETLHPLLQNVQPLSSEEKTEIIAFLLTLTDESFLENKKNGFPMSSLRD